MERDKPCHPRPKHLPERVSKIDKFNCPTRAEIARIESVKPRDAEGMLIRRKWKEKVLAAQKETAAHFQPMETIKESKMGELFALMKEKFPDEMQERWQKRTDAKVRLLYECDKGSRRVSPWVWQKLRELRWVDISDWRRRGLAPIDCRCEREHDRGFVKTVLCRAWASKAQHRRDKWKDSQSEEVEDDEEDGAEDDDDKTIPTSNTEKAEQGECWENIDCDIEENIEQEVLCVVEDPKSEECDMLFEFKDPVLEETFTPGTTVWEDTSEPFREEVFETPPKKPGGTRISDRTLSGEYVLGRPPKKPGGSLPFFLLVLPLLLSGVECKSVKDEGNRKWGLGHVTFAILMLTTLVICKKYKNRIAVAYMRWYFDDHLEEFLSRFKSRSNLCCRKVILAMRRDCNRHLKTKEFGGEKTVRQFKENVDAYFAKLDGEIDTASHVKGYEWEWAGILCLEYICNRDKDMSLEAMVSEEVKAKVKEDFHIELDGFMARFDFLGAEKEALKGIHSAFYRAVQGWYLSYDEVSLALWNKFREMYGRIACEQNGFELGLEHDPIDIISTFFKKIEGEIDESYHSKHGDQEWEKVGMTYFMRLCGKSPEQVHNQSERSSCFELPRTANLDESLPRSHLNLKPDTEVLGDTREDRGDSFFEMFVIAAEVFLSQDNEVCSGEFLELAISALWDKARQSNFLDVPYLNELAVKEQCRIIFEYFDELQEVMISDCVSDIEKLAAHRTFAESLCQEAYLTEPVSDTVESNYSPEIVPLQLGSQVASDSNSNETTLTEEDPSADNIILAEFSGLLREEKSTLLELPSKPNDDDVTAMTADESWDESGSMSSDSKSVVDTCSFHPKALTGTDIRREESRKERDRRLLRQHRESCKGPNLKNKPRRRIKHRTQLDSICEIVEEEDDTSNNQRTLQNDETIPAVTNLEGKEEIVNVGMMKIAQITRERTRKKHWRQPVNARRIKIDRNTGTHANCGLRITKWWTMIALIQPYTCAANRYAKFRSNRRFKPGD